MHSCGMMFSLKSEFTNLHENSAHARVSRESPGQLLLKWDTVGFWQLRVRNCVPEPQVDVQAVHSNHGVHPIGPTVNNEMTKYFWQKHT